MGGISRTLGHLYDPNGNRTRISHSDSFFAYEYDGAGRFSRLLENGGTTVAIALYDPAGRLNRSGWAAATDYRYDPAGRLETLAHDLAGDGGDQTIGLAYNPAGQIRSRSGTNPAFTWSGAATVDRPYSVNGQNQYVAVGPATFAYDANGNLTSDGSTSFVYDAENRLVSASGTTSGAKNAALVYDPLGRLWQVSSAATGVTRFNYDDDALVEESDGAGTVLRRYVHGPAKGVDDPLLWYDNATSSWRRALVSDQQGSIIAVADMHGNAIAINAYDEYGIPRNAQTGAAALSTHGRFQYTGQAWIPELGLYYYKARFYSPTLGRFMQVDPIGYDDQVNLYAYVANDPVNHADPDGEAMQAVLGFVGGFAMDVGLQLYSGKSWKDVNLTTAVGSGIQGAAGLGLLTKGKQLYTAVRAAQRARAAVRPAAMRAAKRAEQGSRQQKVQQARSQLRVARAGVREAVRETGKRAAEVGATVAGAQAAKEQAPKITPREIMERRRASHGGQE